MALGKTATLEEISRTVSKEIEIFRREYRGNFATDAPFLEPVLSYIVQTDGKYIRPIIFFLSQGLISTPRIDSVKIPVLLELVHTASLLHDDVVDRSPVRRGRKTINTVWDNKISVLTGDYLLARVLSLIDEINSSDVLRIVSRLVTHMSRGELRQALDGNIDRMDEENYIQIIYEKTAGLFEAACELAGIAANGSEDEIERLRLLGKYFGIIFQIRDDILDFTGYPKEMGKPVGQDLGDGKMTLPFIVAMRRASGVERREVAARLRRGSKADIDWIYELIKRYDGVEGAQKRARRFVESAIDVLFKFNPSVYRESMEKLIYLDLERVG